MSILHLEEKATTIIPLSCRLKESLSDFGISLRLGNVIDLFQITSRDTAGGSYPYNAGFSRLGQERRNWIASIDNVDTGYYCTGIWKEHSGVIGEVGMVHISPTLRGHGLGPLFSLLGKIELIEGGAEILRALVSADNPTMQALNYGLGFKDTGKRTGGDRQHIEMKMVVCPYTLAELSEQFTTRLRKVTPVDLNFDPLLVDIDNPKRISVRETVLNRPQLLNADFKGDERLIFGYPHAPVTIYLEKANQVGTLVRVVLQVKGKCAENIAFLSKTYSDIFKRTVDKIYPMPGDKLCWEIQSPEIKEDWQIRELAQQFARIGESFFAGIHS